MLLPSGLLLLLVASALAADKCGKLGSRFFNDRLKRIIGGEEISIKDTPWVVRVDTPEGYGCTGTLVTHRHVITAGHCFTDTNTCMSKFHPRGNWSICYQEDKNNKACDERDKFRIKEVIFHDRFLRSGCHPAFDIVLLELDRPVLAGTRVCVPTDDMELDYENSDNSEAHLLGYSDNFDFPGGSAYQNTHLKYATTEVNLVHRKEGTFIISDYDPKRAAICGGDSGGPMFEIHKNKAVLIGVNVAAQGDCSVTRIFPSRYRPEQKTVELKQHLDLIISKLLEKGIEVN